jgi:hypothetical protein
MQSKSNDGIKLQKNYSTEFVLLESIVNFVKSEQRTNYQNLINLYCIWKR